MHEVVIKMVFQYWRKGKKMQIDSKDSNFLEYS